MDSIRFEKDRFLCITRLYLLYFVIGEFRVDKVPKEVTAVYIKLK